MEMSAKEDYKIQSFDPETQNLLKTALKGTAIKYCQQWKFNVYFNTQPYWK